MPVVEDGEVIKETPVDLDRVHELNVQELEAEGVTDDEDTADEGGNNDKPDTPSDDSDDAGDDTGQPDTTPDDEEPEAPSTPAVPEEPAPAPEAPKVDSEPEIDTDITKEAHGKLAVKDADGNTLYFNNMDEVPDDFEPESYKAWGTFTARMAIKEQSDARAAEERRVQLDKAKQDAEISEVTKRWDSEIDVLSKGGILPADEKEREAEIGDTYAYIAKNLSNGVVIDSFAAANKAMKYDRQQEELAQKKKEGTDLKKKRGGMVMGGGGGTPSQKKEPEALPPGTSLDAVHARFSGLN